MKISDLEDADQIVTKDYLRAELQQLKADIMEQLMINQRFNTTMILGLYATNIGFGILILMK